LTDIGHGVSIEIREIDGKAHGVAYTHPRPDGTGMCEGWANFDPFPGAPAWAVHSLSPLTITPSLLCRACGHHGFITNGKWVPA